MPPHTAAEHDGSLKKLPRANSHAVMLVCT
jgi:hypothetical protein